YLICLLGLGIASLIDKNRSLRSFLLLICILITLFGAIKATSSFVKGEILGKPATIYELKLEKDFVLYSIYSNVLAEIQDPDTGKKWLVKDLPLAEMKIGETYFIIMIKEEREIKSSKDGNFTPQKLPNTVKTS
ncbi:MAG: hypothetical protein ABIA04_16440, partial [Pseudomonadota bacterium]